MIELEVRMRQVTAAVIIESGLMLLVRRAPGESLAGYWELPGGKLEDGEDLQSCLERELSEELAMASSVGQELARTVYHYHHGSFEMIALDTARLGDFSLSAHDAFVWASVQDAAQLQLAPADIDLIDQLIALGHWR